MPGSEGFFHQEIPSPNFLFHHLDYSDLDGIMSLTELPETFYVLSGTRVGVYADPFYLEEIRWD
jgi:hypothetical protein